MSKAAELAALIGSQTAQGNRNLIINGAMQVSQRATSATVGPNGTGEGYTVVDRFQNSLTGSVVSTFSQSTDAPSGFANSAKIEITTADTSLAGTEFWHLRYGFEGQDLQSIAKGTSDARALTVSFWVKSNKTGTYTVELQDIDNSRRNSLAYTIDSSNTWEHKSLTYNPDTAGSGFANSNAQSLRINFWFVAGADFKSGTFYNGTWGAEDNAKRVHSSQVNLGDTVGNEWYITGVQMELGEQATPFEHRSFGDELHRCHRYFQGQGTTAAALDASGNTKQSALFANGKLASTGSSTYHRLQAPMQTRMRSAPTAYVSDNNGTLGKAYYNGANATVTTYIATETTVVFRPQAAATSTATDIWINYSLESEL
jgi:hypothetical protein